MDQLAALTEEARDLALNRFRLLQPHLDDDRPLKAVAAAVGIPFRTAQRWVSLYRQFGLAALARKKRTDNGPAPRDVGQAQGGPRRPRPTKAADSSCSDLPSSQAAGTRFGGGAAELLARVSHRRRVARRTRGPRFGSNRD